MRRFILIMCLWVVLRWCRLASLCFRRALHLHDAIKLIVVAVCGSMMVISRHLFHSTLTTIWSEKWFITYIISSGEWKQEKTAQIFFLSFVFFFLVFQFTVIKEFLQPIFLCWSFVTMFVLPFENVLQKQSNSTEKNRSIIKELSSVLFTFSLLFHIGFVCTWSNEWWFPH